MLKCCAKYDTFTGNRSIKICSPTPNKDIKRPDNPSGVCCPSVELRLLVKACQRLPVSESLLFSLLGLIGRTATVPQKHSVPLIRAVIPKRRGSGKEQGGLYKANK